MVAWMIVLYFSLTLSPLLSSLFFPRCTFYNPLPHNLFPMHTPLLLPNICDDNTAGAYCAVADLDSPVLVITDLSLFSCKTLHKTLVSSMFCLMRVFGGSLVSCSSPSTLQIKSDDPMNAIFIHLFARENRNYHVSANRI